MRLCEAEGARLHVELSSCDSAPRPKSMSCRTSTKPRSGVVDDLAEVVAALNLVLDLAEELTDLVFDVFEPLAFALNPCR